MNGTSAVFQELLKDPRIHGIKYIEFQNAQALTLDDDIKNLMQLVTVKNLRGNIGATMLTGDSATAQYYVNRGNQAPLGTQDKGWSKNWSARPLGLRVETFDEDLRVQKEMGNLPVDYMLGRRELIAQGFRKADESNFWITFLSGIQGATIPTTILPGTIDPYTADGKTLFNNAHTQTPGSASTYSNISTSALDYTPDNVKLAWDAAKIESSRGNPMVYKPQRVILSHTLVPIAGVYNSTEKKVGTNYNDTNILQFTGTKSQAPVISNRLPAGYWFLLRVGDDNQLIHKITWKGGTSDRSFYCEQTNVWVMTGTRYERYQAPADPNRFYCPMGGIA